MPTVELQAAYERIEELTSVLKDVRSTLNDGGDPFDIIEASLERIDHALDERVAA